MKHIAALAVLIALSVLLALAAAQDGPAAAQPAGAPLHGLTAADNRRIDRLVIDRCQHAGPVIITRRGHQHANGILQWDRTLTIRGRTRVLLGQITSGHAPIVTASPPECR